jgi:hypothetical protein
MLAAPAIPPPPGGAYGDGGVRTSCSICSYENSNMIAEVSGRVRMVTIPQNSDAIVHEAKSIERIKRKNEVKARKFKQMFK